MSQEGRLSFFVGEFDDQFAAIRTEEPRFCIVRATKEEATSAALKACSFYFKSTAEHPAAVTKSAPMRDIRKQFRPQEAILAVG